MAQHTSFSGGRSALGVLVLALGMAFVGGCAQEAAAPGFAVPWTGVMYPCWPGHVGQRPRPDTVLVDSEFFFPRDERYIEGPQPLSTITASSEFTYDAQPIGLPGGSGYRYRYLYRENVTIP